MIITSNFKATAFSNENRNKFTIFIFINFVQITLSRYLFRFKICLEFFFMLLSGLCPLICWVGPIEIRPILFFNIHLYILISHCSQDGIRALVLQSEGLHHIVNIFVTSPQHTVVLGMVSLDSLHLVFYYDLISLIYYKYHF